MHVLDERFWLRFCSAAALYFASGTSLVDGGGAGDGDGGGGTGGGGDSGGDGDGGGGDGSESPEGEETPDGEETPGNEELGDEGEEDEFGDEDQDEDEETEGSDRATRITDAKIKKGLEAFRKVDAASANALRKEHFQNIDYRRHVGPIAEARLMKETWDGIGGETGLTELQNDKAEYGHELASMAKGDPRSVDELYRDFPEGAKKLTAYALEKLFQSDNSPNGEAARIRAQATAFTAREFGVVSQLALCREIAYGGGPKAQERVLAILGGLEKWFSDVDKFGKSKPETQQDDPRLKELETKGQELNERETQIFRRQVNSSSTVRLNAIVDRHMQSFMKGKNLSRDQKQGFFKETLDEITRRLQKSDEYQKQLKALLSGKNVNKIAKFIAQSADRVAKKSAARAWAKRGFGPAPKGTAKPGAAGGRATGSASARPSLVNKIPEAHTIDWTKDRDRMRFMSGEATLKKEFGGGIKKWDIRKVQ